MLSFGFSFNGGEILWRGDWFGCGARLWEISKKSTAKKTLSGGEYMSSGWWAATNNVKKVL